ncbi:hypothetical protein DY000_02017137 [Brassica cretica]|uniref:DUF1985 domain-containing protein n=1 Tax=Brassica cretica TaxID=69181 RepID=A0ABQ7D361_BRACR|nr:hypothetical protein DY000_02017137 [Brassica cretica]
MVSSRIVDLPKDDVTDEMFPIQEMMFAAGEEPVGVRVLTYQSSRAINHILNSLEEDEIQTLRPLFTIVTGLNCGEFPKRAKAKSKMNINEKPYWSELFGKAEDLRVSTALKMLRRKTVTEKEVRIKLACLTIVSSVPLATNLKMKMIKEHAEAMNTIAVKGFALALQLVMVEAVPALTKVVLETCSSSESDSCDEDDDLTHKKTKKQTLSSGHAREVDKKTDILVRSIIPEDPDRPIVAANLVWADEVVDVKVENLLKLITQRHLFTAEMFKGGATKLDILVRSIIPEDPDRPIVAANLVWADEVVDVKVENLLKLITQRHLFSAEMFKGGATKLDVKRMREIAKAGGSRRGKLNLIHTWKQTRITKFASFKTTVMVSIQNLLNNFKEEVIRSVIQINSSANTTTQPARPNVDTTNNAKHKLDIVQPQRDSNDEIIALWGI